MIQDCVRSSTSAIASVIDATLGRREVRGKNGEESDWIGGSTGVGTE